METSTVVLGAAIRVTSSDDWRAGLPEVCTGHVSLHLWKCELCHSVCVCVCVCVCVQACGMLCVRVCVLFVHVGEVDVHGSICVNNTRMLVCSMCTSVYVLFMTVTVVNWCPAPNSSLLMNFPHSPQGGPSSQVDSCRHSPGLPKTP